MLAHYHGQTWNAREPAQAMGVNYRAGALFGVECKRTDSSRLTPSMRIASSDLGLRGISVIYPGTKRCPMIGTAGKRLLFFMVDSPRGPDNGYDARIPIHGLDVAALLAVYLLLYGVLYTDGLVVGIDFLSKASAPHMVVPSLQMP